MRSSFIYVSKHFRYFTWRGHNVVFIFFRNYFQNNLVQTTIMGTHLERGLFSYGRVSTYMEYLHAFLSKHECDLFCLQEIWPLNENLPKPGNTHDNYVYTCKSDEFIILDYGVLF